MELNVVLSYVWKAVLLIIMVEAAVELLKPLAFPIKVFYPAFRVMYMLSIVLGIAGAFIFEINIASALGAVGNIGYFITGFVFARMSNYLHGTIGRVKTDLMDIIEAPSQK